jgi:hypothetical protein
LSSDKHFINEIIRLSERLVDIKTKPKRQKEIFSSDDRSTALIDDDLDAYRDLRNNFSKKWEDTHSEKFIASKLHKLLIDYALEKDNEKLKSEFRKLQKELSSWEEEFTVYIPILGLEIETEELALGKIILKKSKDVKNYIIERWEKSHGGKEFDELTKKNNDDLIKFALSQIRSSVCAEIKIKAESGKAEEKAVNQIRNLIKIFKYILSFSSYDSSFINVSVEGDSFFSTRCYPMISDKDNIAIPAGWSSLWQPLRINEQSLTEFNKFGLFDLAQLIQKLNQSNYETMLVRALEWIALGYDHKDKNLKFLCFMNCLETFFSDERAIARVIGESAAFILNKETNERLEINKKILNFYRIRSNLAHGGSEKVKDDDLSDIIQIACYSFMELLFRRNHFRTRKEMVDYIEKYKFSNDATMFDIGEKS